MRTGRPLARLIIGARYGMLTVLQDGIMKPGPQQREHWARVKCDCGNAKEVRVNHLKRGQVTHCGCIPAGFKHGGADTQEYRAWKNMRARCRNPNRPDYKHYGGRGITFDDRWNSFENFLADMGPAPSPTHSIDRIDVNGPYCKENCRWAMQSEQMRNIRTNHWIEFNGERMIMEDWAKRIGITPWAMLVRLRRWPLEKALTTPPSKTL